MTMVMGMNVHDIALTAVDYCNILSSSIFKEYVNSQIVWCGDINGTTTRIKLSYGVDPIKHPKFIVMCLNDTGYGLNDTGYGCYEIDQDNQFKLIIGNGIDIDTISQEILQRIAYYCSNL